MSVTLSRPARGITVALMDETDRQLGPAVVSPPTPAGPTCFDLRGPCLLPPGTVVRCTVDVADGTTYILEHPVDRRRGFHAFLHADALLPVTPVATLVGLEPADQARLAERFPWLRPPAKVAGSCCDDAEVLQMLRDEFDVDPDDIDETLVEQLRGRA